MKQASLIMGMLAFIGMLFGFIPCLGAFNWINIPFAIIGLVISIVAYNEIDGKPRSNALAGIAMCSAAIVIGFFRLMIGGGVV